MSDDAPDDPSGRFNTPTRQATPRRSDDAKQTVRDRPSGGEREPAALKPSVSVFDPPRIRFDEQEELGRGGMGRVVEARDLALDRPVAIKHLLATGLDDHARFEREVRITARLQHPSIVPILDAGRDENGQPFYIMRKIDGDPLSARVAAATTVRDRIALVPAMLGAIDAAAYAHAQGVIHRDIKPWNILLGPFGETLLIDWGIARDLGTIEERSATKGAPDRPDSGLTRLGDAVGTPGFMAPEQARGEAVDRRADVYSLGATLFFVLTGALPFAGSDATLAIAKVAAGLSPDLASIPEEVPAELAAIVSKALAPDREARYTDASELAADLRRFLAGQLVAAHRYTTGERFVRWIRRHRLVSAVIVVAAIAIAAVAIVAFRSVVAERDQARSARGLAETRAEELLVDRARSLVTTDPTSAVALLRSLPEGSDLWPVAREIVRAAVTAGVERGISTGNARAHVIAVSPAGRIAIGTMETIVLVDLERKIDRVLVKHAANQLAWRDETTLVFAESQQSANTKIGVIDVATGHEQELRPRALRRIAVAKGYILIHNADGSLDAFDPTLKEEQLASAGVSAIDVSGTHAVVAASDMFVVFEPGGSIRKRAVAFPQSPARIELSPRGDRVAILLPDEISEWQVDGDAPPRRWPRSGSSNQDLAYVGDTLHAWDDTDGGLVSFERALPVTKWSYRGLTLKFAEFKDGIVIATEEGRIAYVDALGAVELPHRRLQLKTVGVTPEGKDLLLASVNGDLMAIDLRHVRPKLLPIAATTRLHSVSTTHLVVGESAVNPMGAAGSTRLALIEIATGKRTELGDVGFGPSVWVRGSVIIVGTGAGPEPRTLKVLELDGRERLRAPYDSHLSIGEGLSARTSVIYGTDTGDLIEQPLDPPGPSRIVRAADGRRVSSIARTPRGTAISSIDSGGPDGGTRTVIEWLPRDGRQVPPLHVDGFVTSPGLGPDGAWWLIENYERVSRQGPDGKRVPIPLNEPINHIMIRGSRIWALGTSVLYELATDGAVVRTVSLPVSRKRGHLDDGVTSLSVDGLWITMPAANVSRLLPLPGGAAQQAATRDGRFVAVVTPSDTPQVAVWTDPVPVEPSAIPAYIEHLTNARLDLASSAVTWDLPRP